jgi:hypothetical protein
MVEGYAFAAVDSKVWAMGMLQTVKRYKAIGALSQAMSYRTAYSGRADPRQQRSA